MAPSGINEAKFSISGKINMLIIITVISSILGIGAMGANLMTCKERLDKLESRAFVNDEDHTKILGTLIRIEENSRFLKERLEDFKNSRGLK